MCDAPSYGAASRRGTAQKRAAARERIGVVNSPSTLTTDRLVLRQWREADLEPFAAMNADPQVMRFFPRRLDREASDAMAHRLARHLDEHGWGLWAVEVPDVAPFIGFIGLAPVPFDAHFTPAIEVGWRLDKAYWGRGYAPEGARAALDHAFGTLGLDEVVSMTIPINEPSQRVMRKLGLTRDPADDFDHPTLPNWEHRRHVLYRIQRAEWTEKAVVPL
jgi:RimJ/RimL family protein N-acetyltransferase